MQKLEFAEAVDLVTSKFRLFDRDAYFFLKDALDYTVSLHKKSRASGGCHVSGQQLLEGVREFALKQFGPMVMTVFEYWNIRACEDVGRMVFHLIEVGVFGKSDKDSIEDFKGGYSFHEAFVRPFLPNFEKLAPGRIRRTEPSRGRAQKSAKTSAAE